MMFALVALSILLATFASIVSKKLSRTAHSANNNPYIKTVECKTLINTNCLLCNIKTLECLSCKMDNSLCPTGKTLNYKECKCK